MADITTELAQALGSLSTSLVGLDDRIDKMTASVDRFTSTQDDAEERQKAVNNVAREGAKLTELERKLRIREYKFRKQRLRDEQKSFKDLSKITNLFTKGMSVAVTKLQIFSKSLGNKILSSIGGAAKGALGGVFNKAKGMLPLAAILSVPGLIVRQLLKVSTTMAELAKTTGLVGSNLTMVTNNVEQATAGLYAFGMNMEDVGRQAGALVDALGNASYVTEQLITNTSLIAKATGMSADEAANLTSTLIKGFNKTTPQVKEFADNMMSFASTSGVNARKVMRDISNDSNLTSIYLGRGEDALMRSAVLAAKMGKSMAEQNQTLDAFSTIEGAMETVAEINIRTGANLNAQKMFMLFQTQDIEGALRELQKAFSTPQAQANLDAFPGAFKAVASSLNMSVKDLRQLDKVMADFQKSSMGASKEQQQIEDHIKAGMDLLEQMKGIFFSAILPAFNNIGKMLMENIKPTLNDVTDIASNLGKNISKAMDAEETLGGKLKALFNQILTVMQPAFAKIGTILGSGIYEGLITALKGSLIGRIIVGAIAGGKAGAVIGTGVGAVAGAGVGAVPASVAGAIAGTLIGGIGGALAGDAKGNVYNRPTLGLIGEENRSEVVIPTERIRKGLPVNPIVASELRSIGVPGFFAGGRGGGSAITTAQLTDASNTFALRQQQRAVLSSQGDPEAIRRVEAKIEEQAAKVRKDQRSLVNDIMEETLSIERARYDDDVQSDGEKRERDKRDKEDGFSFRQFEKGLHNVLTGVDNFMQVTGTGFKDIIPGLRNQLENDESFFRQLPVSLQTGLTTGIETAYDKFLETGKLEDAVRAGAAAGVRAGVEKSGPNTKVAGQIVADMLEGQSFRESLGGVLSRAQNDPQSRLNKTMEGLRKSSEVTEGMGAKAIGAASKAAGALGALEGGIAAFQAGEGVQGVAKSAISQGVGQFSGKAIEGALMNTPLAPFAPILGQIGGGLIGKGVGKALGALGLGGKRVKPAGARTKITDALTSVMMGVTREGPQLSRHFAAGSPKHRIMQANLAIAAAKSPEKLYNKVGDIMYNASGMSFSTDRVAEFVQALFKADAAVIDMYEKEMETGISPRAGASGAIVTRPTVALIGEAGPEALMPLENAPGARPLNGVGGDGGELLQEIKRMNQMLGAMANRPITLDGQRVNAVLNAANSDDIRAGIYTVNSR